MNILIINIIPQPYKCRHLIEEKIASILFDSYYFPENQNQNGAFFIDNYHFAANVKILGSKLGINANSLNKDFRYHKIKYVQKMPPSKAADLFDSKGWKIYQHSHVFFSLENILNGNKCLTTKWERNTKKKT